MLLNAPEEREAISSPDAALDTNVSAVSEPQKDETQLQSQENSGLMEREAPSNEQQAHIALEAIQEQFRVSFLFARPLCFMKSVLLKKSKMS